MAVTKQPVIICHCERCGHDWIPRTALSEPDALPIVCGNRSCKSPYWNKPRVGEAA